MILFIFIDYFAPLTGHAYDSASDEAAATDVFLGIFMCRANSVKR